MESTVLPWIKTVAGDRPWVWQQDSAPCHVSNRSIEWLKDHCYDDLVSKDCLPPSSPVLNPWTILWGATWRHILTDVKTIHNPYFLFFISNKSIEKWMFFVSLNKKYDLSWFHLTTLYKSIYTCYTERIKTEREAGKVLMLKTLMKVNSVQLNCVYTFCLKNFLIFLPVS